MKRIICAVLAGALCVTAALSLSGCGCSRNNSEPGYTVEATEPDLRDGDFGYYVINKNELMITEYKGTDKTIEIPETYKDYTITSIGSFVFDSCEAESITMPDTIKSIGDYAFASSKNLKSIKLSKNLETLGSNSFFFCRNLEEIELPASIKYLGIYTFSGTGLKSVTIPESETLTEIDSYVFYQCSNLTEVTIPKTITKMEPNVFSDSKSPITIKGSSGSYAEEYVKEFGQDKENLNNLVFEAQ